MFPQLQPIRQSADCFDDVIVTRTRRTELIISEVLQNWHVMLTDFVFDHRTSSYCHPEYNALLTVTFQTLFDITSIIAIRALCHSFAFHHIPGFSHVIKFYHMISRLAPVCLPSLLKAGFMSFWGNSAQRPCCWQVRLTCHQTPEDSKLPNCRHWYENYVQLASSTAIGQLAQ